MSFDSQDSNNSLPDTFQLAEFTLQKRIGEGGFSIVYLAKDTSLDRLVAIKEYMPSSLASRSSDLTVSVKSDRYLETFNAGMKSFINEAKLLGQFDHASVVKVYRFFESNGTAYMVMPFYEGRTLKQVLKDMGGPPDEAWLKSLLRPVMDALELIHSYQCFHRDIAPDNIMILGDGRPLLIDFGAARRVIGDMTQALTAILKPGFAPIEQYADIPGIRQGGWTDVYALAGVIYYALMGKAPVPSVARVVTDSLVPLTKQLQGRYSEQFLSGIDAALKVRPEERIQSATEFRDALGLDSEAKPQTVDLSGAGFGQKIPFDETQVTVPRSSTVSSRPVTRRATAQPELTNSLPNIPPSRGFEAKSGATLFGATSAASTGASALAASSTLAVSAQPATSVFSPASPQSPASLGKASAKASSKLPLTGGIIAVVAALTAGVWWFAQSPSKPSAVQNQSASAPPPPATPASIPSAVPPLATGQGPGNPSAGANASPPSPPSAQGPATAQQAMANLPDAQKFIRTLEARANAESAFTIEVPKNNLVIGKDQLKLNVTPKQNGFLYVFLAGSAGDLTQLFPNGIDSDHKVSVGKTVAIPPSSKYSFTAGGPAGKDVLFVMLSKTERDFSDAGARKIGEFFSFDYPKMNARIESAGSDILLGKAKCTDPSQSDCQTFWVDKIEITETNAAKESSKATGAKKKSTGY